MKINRCFHLPSSAVTLGFGIALLIALSLAMSTWLDVVDAQTRFGRHVENRGQILVVSTSEFIQDAVYLRDIDRLRDAIEVVSAQPGVSFVEILDGNGQPIVSSSRAGREASAQAARIFEHRIAPGGQTVGLVRIGLDDAELQEEISSIARKEIWQGTTLFITGTVLAIVLGILFAAPLRRVAAAARQMEQGDLTARIDPAGPSETRDLGAAFNRMADRIESNEQRMVLDQEKLERRVAERTEEINAVSRIGVLFSSGPDIRNIFKEFGAQFNELVEHEGLALYQYDTDGGRLMRVSCTGAVRQWPGMLSLPASWDGAPDGQFEVSRITGQEEHDSLFGHAETCAASSETVAVPLLGSRELIGALFVSRATTGFDDAAIGRCQRVGTQIAGALASFVLYERNMEMAAERQRALEEERRLLKAADEAKDEFLSSLSHELRTPLVAILGYTDLLVRKLSDRVDADSFEHLKTIERNGNRLNAQIEDLLDLSRIQTRQLEISAGWTEWRSFVADVELSMRPLLDAGGHRLVFDVRHGELWVNIDSVRMNQVVSNMISNAGKYSPGADRVDVVSEVVGGQMVLSVTDYGVGIEPDEMENLFTLFYRTRAAVASAAPGTGIGLYVARRIVELHQGELSIESEYGKGTTARLKLSSAASRPPVEQPLAAPAFKNRFDDLTA